MNDRYREASERADAVVEQITSREPRVKRARARYELISRLFRGTVAVFLVAILALLIYLTASANDGAEAVRDCTEPGGVCYQRSQEQAATLMAQLVRAQQDAARSGSAPARENLSLTQQNTQNIEVILGILDRQYPEAAAAVRAELSKEGTKP